MSSRTADMNGDGIVGDAGRLASDYKGNPVQQYLLFYRLGVDGLFSDFADTAFAARVLFHLEHDRRFDDCFTGVSRRDCD